MKYLAEFRNEMHVRRLLEAIHKATTQPWKIMEVCGGQTHAIVRYALDQVLPDSIELLHGPGCPVCVTPLSKIDVAIELARRPDVILCSFGDMMRVPGSQLDLLAARAEGGGHLRLVYSPLDAVTVAEQNPQKQVVFFAVGFETTAPANALAVLQAQAKGLENFSLLVSQVLVPPALACLMQSPDTRVDGFLAAGHVCTIMGVEEYEPICQRYRVPIVVTGFEPVDILRGILACVEQLEAGRPAVENQYARSVREGGNAAARRVLEQVFEVRTRQWRGIGQIPESGLGLKPAFAAFDAEVKLGLHDRDAAEPAGCLSGRILQGVAKPTDCPHFGVACTPDAPMGATMVSSEGACSAYYRYRRDETHA